MLASPFAHCVLWNTAKQPGAQRSALPNTCMNIEISAVPKLPTLAALSEHRMPGSVRLPGPLRAGWAKVAAGTCCIQR